MTISLKPVLYNGFKINGDLVVLNRIERTFFTDVYKLSNERYLYLFLNLDPNSVIRRDKTYDIIEMKNGSKLHIGAMVDVHSTDERV